MDDRDLKLRKQALEHMAQADAEDGVDPKVNPFSHEMIAHADGDGAVIVSHPSLLDNELKDMALTEQGPRNPKKNGFNTVEPKALTGPLVTKEPPQEYFGPGVPKDAYYPEDEQRPVNLRHDKAYTDAQLKAAEILQREEGFLPTAKFDKTRPRIGYSTEEYEDGTPVKMGDVVGEDQAYDMMMNRVLRDSKIMEPFKDRMPLLNDPDVEAVALSRAYHQGPGNVVSPAAARRKKLPALYKALTSNSKKKFAEAVKKAVPDKHFKKRLEREAASLVPNKKK